MKTGDKNINIEVLRVLSMICVVFLHSAANALRANLNTFQWDILNLLSSFATTSVPLFFMISGALILGSEKTYSLEYTLKKRVARILVPTVIASFAAVFKEYFFVWYDQGIIDIWGAVKKFLTFPQNYVTVHLWFVYFLIPMYLISPVLKFLVDKCPSAILKYVGILWGINVVSFTLRPILPTFLQPMLNWAFISNIGFINDYLGHFVLGYYLYTRKYKISNKHLNAAVIVLGILISVITAFVTEKNAEYSEWFKSYKNLAVIALSCAVFLRVMRMEKFPKFLVFAVKQLSPLTFGIYLMHNIYISAYVSFYEPALGLKAVGFLFCHTMLVSVVIIKIILLTKNFILKK